MLIDRAEQAVVLVEVVDVLAPEVGRRQHQTVVLGKERLLVRSLDVLDVQANVAERDVRLVVVDDLEELEDLEERPAESIGECQLLVPRQHDAPEYYLLHVNKWRLGARPW